MSEELLRYDIWVEEALRSVIRKTIAHVAETGLPGDHHFYISFHTHDPGVKIPARLRAEHPHDMTIVLQHQFEHLVADEDSFSITLSFSGRKETLTVPYAAVISFADPSVNFALQLKMLPMDDEDEARFDDDDEYDARHLDYFEETRNRTDQDDGDGDKGDGDGGDDKKTGEVIALDAFRKK